MSYRTIRELRELTGVTESALRYYDEKNILQPSVKNRTGRREWLYDEDALWSLMQIMFYKRAGMTVEEAGELIGAESEDRLRIIANHLERLRQKHNDVSRQIVDMELLILIDGLYDDAEQKNQILREVIKQR